MFRVGKPEPTFWLYQQQIDLTAEPFCYLIPWEWTVEGPWVGPGG